MQRWIEARQRLLPGRGGSVVCVSPTFSDGCCAVLRSRPSPRSWWAPCPGCLLAPRPGWSLLNRPAQVRAVTAPSVLPRWWIPRPLPRILEGEQYFRVGGIMLGIYTGVQKERTRLVKRLTAPPCLLGMAGGGSAQAPLPAWRLQGDQPVALEGASQPSNSWPGWAQTWESLILPSSSDPDLSPPHRQGRPRPLSIRPTCGAGRLPPTLSCSPTSPATPPPSFSLEPQRAFAAGWKMDVAWRG